MPKPRKRRSKGKARPPPPPKPPSQTWAKRWWKRVGIALTVFGFVSGLVFGVPSILPKLSVVHASTEMRGGKAYPRFEITNEGVIDLHNVSGSCLFKSVKYARTDYNVHDNIMPHTEHPLGELDVGGAATVVCSTESMIGFQERPIAASLSITVRYRASWVTWHSEVTRNFESFDGLQTFTPEPIR